MGKGRSEFMLILRQRFGQGQHLGAPIQPVAALTWCDHKQPIEFQIRQGLAHRGAQPGCIGPLDLHADPPAPQDHQQIQFGAAMGGPEPGAVGRQAASSCSIT